MSLPLLDQLKQILTASRASINKSILALIQALQVELDSQAPASFSATVESSAWKESGGVYEAVISNSAIGKDDLAFVNITSGLEEATSSGLFNTCETEQEALKLKAKKVPKGSLGLTYWIEKGKGT